MSELSITCDEAEQLVDSTFVNSVHYYSEVQSTNDEALKGPASMNLPALFIAAKQTGGRGRGSNRWISSQGALTFSLLVSPVRLRSDKASWPQLSLWTALGIRDSIASLTENSDVQVKWPNDVFLQQRKVCGILCEFANSLSDSDPHLVVGVGINVNNDLTTATNRDDTRNAIAMSQSRVGSISVAEVARSVLTHIHDAWNLFENQHCLLDHWPDHCFLTGRRVNWRSDDDSVHGICQGVSEDGALLLTTPDSNELTKRYGGTVSYETNSTER